MVSLIAVPGRLVLGAIVVALIAVSTSGCSVVGGTEASHAPRGQVTLQMVTVGDAGNPSVGVVSLFGAQGDVVNTNPPANGGIYQSCAQAPPGRPSASPWAASTTPTRSASSR